MGSRRKVVEAHFLLKLGEARRHYIVAGSVVGFAGEQVVEQVHRRCIVAGLAVVG